MIWNITGVCPLNNNLKILWRILYSATAKLLPQSTYCAPAKYLRAFFAHRICANAGKRLNIERGATFGSKVSIGDNSGIGVNCELHGEVNIGNNVLMAPECIFYTVNHEFSKVDVPIGTQGDSNMEPINVGNDVWFGRRVMVMPGVSIGDHSIVAAGSVVTRDVPPYSIVGGAPARVIKKRA